MPHFFSKHRALWPFLGLIAAMTALNLAPSVRLLYEALASAPASGQTPSAWPLILSDPLTWYATRNTLVVGFWGTVIAVVLGAFFALATTLSDLPRKNFWVFAFMLPMMIPPQITALAWLQLLGPSSTLLQSLNMAPALGSPQPLYSPAGIALLLGVQLAPLVFLSLRASLIALPGDLYEAARLSGAKPWQVIWTVVLPLARPGLVAGAAMAFVSALGNFGIPAMLGIPVGYYTLATLIYQKLASFGPTMLSQVSVLSLLVGLLAMLGVALQSRLQAKARYRLVGMQGKPTALALGPWRWVVEGLIAAVLLFILAAPLLALLTSSLVPAMGVSLTPQTFTLHAYAEMLGRQGATWRATGNSLLLASGAAIALMLLCLPAAWFMARYRGATGRWVSLVNAVLEVPYALPGTVLAVACILLFAKPLPFIQVSLYGTLGIIFVAYLARFMAMSLKPVQAGMQQLDPALEEAAQLAGAGVWRRLWSIVLPLLAPSAFAGALLVFLTAVNELTVSALLWSAGNETLGVLIFNYNESGETVLASAIAVVITAGVIGLMAAMSVLGTRLPKGVIPWRN